ncbi:MAG: hypothetical protein RL375_2532 [Pseudomonadota bacterium]|jgi:hypothetical protein
MTIYLKQSTASQEVLLGPFVDSTDGNAAETALTINNTDIKLHKTGATTLASKNSGGATHISNGNYYAVLDATDTDTLGPLAIVVQVSGALAVRHQAVVLAANIYDSLIGGGDLLDVSVTQWLGTACATPTVAGVPEVDPTHWNGTAVATPATAGYPAVTIKSGTGTGEISLSSGRVLLQSGIRKNQAIANFPFLMTDSTNHNPATGLTVTATRSIDGAAFASGTIANMTEVASGLYQCDLGAGDLNGDTIALRFTATGADDLVVTLITEP